MGKGPPWQNLPPLLDEKENRATPYRGERLSSKVERRAAAKADGPNRQSLGIHQGSRRYAENEALSANVTKIRNKRDSAQEGIAMVPIENQRGSALG